MGEALDCVDLGEGVLATQISAGADYTCAVTANKDEEYLGLKCWGGNDQGQLGLGLGDYSYRGNNPGEMGDALPFVDLGNDDLQVLSLARGSGNKHTCAVVTGGLLYCWGGNQVGQLGLEHSGKHAKPELVNLGLNADVASATMGRGHTCAVLTDGRGVKCWGTGTRSRLGLGDTASRGSSSGTMGDSLPLVNLALRVEALASGDAINCALSTAGAVKCWGEGAIGYGEFSIIGSSESDMGVNLQPLELAGTVAFPKAISALGTPPPPPERSDEDSGGGAISSEDASDAYDTEDAGGAAPVTTASLALELQGESVATFTEGEQQALLTVIKEVASPYPVAVQSIHEPSRDAAEARRRLEEDAVAVTFAVTSLPDDEAVSQVTSAFRAAVTDGSLFTRYEAQLAATSPDTAGTSATGVTYAEPSPPSSGRGTPTSAGAVVGGIIMAIVVACASWFCCGASAAFKRRREVSRVGKAPTFTTATATGPGTWKNSLSFWRFRSSGDNAEPEVDCSESPAPSTQKTLGDNSPDANVNGRTEQEAQPAPPPFSTVADDQLPTPPSSDPSQDDEGWLEPVFGFFGSRFEAIASLWQPWTAEPEAESGSESESEAEAEAEPTTSADQTLVEQKPFET
ncbi:unnamed protein product [Chrysoparadoxa australica]